MNESCLFPKGLHLKLRSKIASPRNVQFITDKCIWCPRAKHRWVFHRSISQNLKRAFHFIFPIRSTYNASKVCCIKPLLALWEKSFVFCILISVKILVFYLYFFINISFCLFLKLWLGYISFHSFLILVKFSTSS